MTKLAGLVCNKLHFLNLYTFAIISNRASCRAIKYMILTAFSFACKKRNPVAHVAFMRLGVDFYQPLSISFRRRKVFDGMRSKSEKSVYLAKGGIGVINKSRHVLTFGQSCGGCSHGQSECCKNRAHSDQLWLLGLYEGKVGVLLQSLA